MPDENVWLSGRRKAQQALIKIIAAVGRPEVDNDAVRGAGTRTRA